MCFGLSKSTISLTNLLRNGGEEGMEVSKVLYRFNRDDHFLYQLRAMQESLHELAAIIDRQQKVRPPIEPRVIYRPVIYRPAPTEKKRIPVLLPPFNLLAAMIDGLLVQLEHFAAWLVQKGLVRVLARIKCILHPPKRSR
jgi:hypothetical protein